MVKKPHHGNKWMPVMYANYYGILKDIAEEHGYALAVHGTLDRDLDLIAVPWTEDASSPSVLIEAFCKSLGSQSVSTFEQKPHGRAAYSIITGGGGYIDISVMPKIINTP